MFSIKKQYLVILGLFLGLLLMSFFTFRKDTFIVRAQILPNLPAGTATNLPSATVPNIPAGTSLNLPSTTASNLVSPTASGNGVTVIPPLCDRTKGDANCDGAINDTDYQNWRFGIEQGGMPRAADDTTRNDPDPDFNRDGRIDMKDFEIWRRNAL